MPLITLHNTSLSLSPICLGTNQFGTALSDDTAAQIVDTYIELGGNFFDTARSYGDWIPDVPSGASETALGQQLKRYDRNSLVLATKGGEFDYRAGDFALRANPECIQGDLTASLEALQTDYIDMYWLHRDDVSVPVGELVDVLVEAKNAGTIRYYGCSNWSPERIIAAQEYASVNGHDGFAACQPLWGLAEPNREAMQMYCPGGYYEDGYKAIHQSGLPMIPYSGQCRGFFSKLAAGGEASLQEDLAALYLNDANKRRLDIIQSMAAKRSVSINQVVLAYLLSQPAQTIPIIGASSAEQPRDSFSACALKLSTDELTALRDA